MSISCAARMETTLSIYGAAAAVAGEVADGDAGIDTIRATGSNSFQAGSLVEIERFQFAAAATLTFAPSVLNGDFTFVGDGNINKISIVCARATTLSMEGFTFAGWATTDTVTLTGSALRRHGDWQRGRRDHQWQRWPRPDLRRERQRHPHRRRQRRHPHRRRRHRHDRRRHRSRHHRSGTRQRHRQCAATGNDNVDGGAGNDILNSGAGYDVTIRLENAIFTKVGVPGERDRRAG